MRTTTTRVATGAIAAALGATLLVSMPADADSIVTKDRAGDSRYDDYGDVRKVKVNHGPKAVRLVISAPEGGNLADFHDVWIDTDAANPGPEYLSVFSLETLPGVGVGEVDSFDRDSLGDSTCAVPKARQKGRTLVATYPRACFGTPDRLRVGVEASMEYGVSDWAPGKRKFGRWVLAG